MATLIVDYGVLSAISGRANSLSKKAGKYADKLTEKVLDRFDNVEGPSSEHMSNAKYYVKKKISALREKEESFSNFATQIRDFSDKAKRVDEAVEKMLARNQEKFLDRHEHLRIDEWKAKLLNWLVDLKNSCPLFELIGNALRAIDTALGSLLDNLRYWYECEGGRQAFAFVVAIVGLVIAIALVIVTWPASLAAASFAAVCSAIGAVITAINALVNVYTSWRAYDAAKNGDPAWAKIYGNQDKLSDVLRQTNFDNAFLNRLFDVVATGIDVVELFCDIVGLVEAIKDLPKIFEKFQDIRWKEVLDWDYMGKPCGTKMVMQTDKNGRILYDISWRRGFEYSHWNKPGTKERLREILKFFYDVTKFTNESFDRDHAGVIKAIISGTTRGLPIVSQINDFQKIIADINEMLSGIRRFKRVSAH